MGSENRIFSPLSEVEIQEDIIEAKHDNRIGLIGVAASVVVAIGSVIYASRADKDFKAEMAVIPAVAGAVGVIVSGSRLISSGQVEMELVKELDFREQNPQPPNS